MPGPQRRGTGPATADRGEPVGCADRRDDRRGIDSRFACIARLKRHLVRAAARERMCGRNLRADCAVAKIPDVGHDRAVVGGRGPAESHLEGRPTARRIRRDGRHRPRVADLDVIDGDHRARRVGPESEIAGAVRFVGDREDDLAIHREAQGVVDELDLPRRPEIESRSGVRRQRHRSAVVIADNAIAAIALAIDPVDLVAARVRPRLRRAGAHHHSRVAPDRVVRIRVGQVHREADLARGEEHGRIAHV